MAVFILDAVLHFFVGLAVIGVKKLFFAEFSWFWVFNVSDYVDFAIKDTWVIIAASVFVYVVNLGMELYFV